MRFSLSIYLSISLELFFPPPPPFSLSVRLYSDSYSNSVDHGRAVRPHAPAGRARGRSKGDHRSGCCGDTRHGGLCAPNQSRYARRCNRCAPGDEVSAPESGGEGVIPSAAGPFRNPASVSSEAPQSASPLPLSPGISGESEATLLLECISKWGRASPLSLSPI